MKNEKEAKVILQMHKQGYFASTIAQKTGLSLHFVSSMIHRLCGASKCNKHYIENDHKEFIEMVNNGIYWIDITKRFWPQRGGAAIMQRTYEALKLAGHELAELNKKGRNDLISKMLSEGYLPCVIAQKTNASQHQLALAAFTMSQTTGKPYAFVGQMKELADLYKSGATMPEICEHFGVQGHELSIRHCINKMIHRKDLSLKTAKKQPYAVPESLIKDAAPRNELLERANRTSTILGKRKEEVQKPTYRPKQYAPLPKPIPREHQIIKAHMRFGIDAILRELLSEGYFMSEKDIKKIIKTFDHESKPK